MRNIQEPREDDDLEGTDYEIEHDPQTIKRNLLE